MIRADHKIDSLLIMKIRHPQELRCSKQSRLRNKRSQSENRNRDLDTRLLKDELEDFNYMFKSTLKNLDREEEFFAKRKINKHSNSSKNVVCFENPFRYEASLSEKKQLGTNLLRQAEDYSEHILPFNLSGNYESFLRHSNFDKTCQFGGMESIANTTKSTLFPNDEISSVGTNCDRKTPSNLLANQNADAIFQ